VTVGLPFAEACERNKAPILKALEAVLPTHGRILEIGSGTGQHVVYFAGRLPGWTWQPSERPENLPGLAARIEAEGGANILPAVELDVTGDWPNDVFDAVYSSNTSHIMGWEKVQSMLRGVGEHLACDGLFLLYGPFSEAGLHTAPGNAAFDRQLRGRDPRMGLRDVEALESEGLRHQMVLERRFPMPANNQLLLFRKRKGLRDGVSDR